MPKLAAVPLPVVTLEIKPEPKLVTSTKLDTLLEDYMTVCAKLDQLKAKKDQLAASLQSDWHKRHGKLIETDDYLSTEVESHNSSISKELLLKAGVKVAIIQASTKQTPYRYVKVTRKKDVKL